MASDLFLAFLQGVSGVGLFGRLQRPGAPTEFIDSRSLEEFFESGEFEETLSRYRAYIPERPKQPDYSEPIVQVMDKFNDKHADADSVLIREDYKARSADEAADFAKWASARACDARRKLELKKKRQEQQEKQLFVRR